MDLASLFRTIPQPVATTSGNSFSAERIPSFEAHYLARNESGLPSLLVSSTNSGRSPPLRLIGIEIKYCLPCKIALKDNSEETRQFTTVICTAPDEPSRQYFFYVCELLIRVLGQSPSFDEVVYGMSRLVDLLQKIGQPARKSVVGVLGELIVIFASNSITSSVRAWRSRVDERFDFSIEDARLEVKAASDRVRSHSVSFEQCNPPNDTKALLASVFIEIIGGGLQFSELIANIERKLNNEHDLILRLQETLADTLGASLLSAMSLRFDEQLAIQSLCFYNLKAIPAIRPPLPHNISEVRFRADLRSSNPLTSAELKGLEGIMKDLIPMV